MSLVERAKAAAVAERETAELQRQARIIANRARVVALIQELAERGLGLDLAADQIVLLEPDARERSEYGYEQELTPDATLVIKGRIDWNDQPELVCGVRPSSTLYYNLAPDGSEQRAGGGHYGLTSLIPARTLAKVGEALDQIEKVREKYERHWAARRRDAEAPDA